MQPDPRWHRTLEGGLAPGPYPSKAVRDAVQARELADPESQED